MSPTAGRRGWTPGRLKDLVEFQRGFDITKAEQRDGPYPVISSSGTTSYHDEFMASGPGVILGRKGTVGSVHFSAEDYWPHDTTLWSKDLRGNDARYIFYFLQTIDLKRFDVGNSNPTLNRNHIHDLPILIPSRTLQRRIAAALSAYDELIENNRRRMALLEEAARQLYREWFVRLRFPGHEHTPLTNGLPQGWARGPLEEALVLQRGFDLPNQDREPGSVPVCGSTGVGGFHSTAMAKGPGVITGRSGSLGEVYFVPEDYWPLNTALWVREFKKVSPLCALFLLRELDLKQYNGGASVPTLDRKTVHKAMIIIPPRRLIDLFDEACSPMFAQITTLKSMNDKLRAARDLLLPRLMSGEIAV